MMDNDLDRVDYKVNRKAKRSQRLSNWQIAVFVLLLIVVCASLLTIAILLLQINDLRQQNELLIATIEALRKATPQP